jgi:hypothetical protein
MEENNTTKAKRDRAQQGNNFCQGSTEQEGRRKEATMGLVHAAETDNKDSWIVRGNCEN